MNRILMYIVVNFLSFVIRQDSMLWTSNHGIPIEDQTNQYYENNPIIENNEESYARSEQEHESYNKELNPTFDDTTNEYYCTICSHKSTYKSSIIRHMRNHSGIKPFLCKFCPYRTCRNEDLKKHLRKHTREKPYICNFCNKAFSQSSTLYSHVVRLHKY